MEEDKPHLNPINAPNLVELLKARIILITIGQVLSLGPLLFKKVTFPKISSLQVIIETFWYAYIIKRYHFPAQVQ